MIYSLVSKYRIKSKEWAIETRHPRSRKKVKRHSNKQIRRAVKQEIREVK